MRIFSKKTLMAAFLIVAAAVSANGADLLVPRGIVYSYGSFTLTRDCDETETTHVVGAEGHAESSGGLSVDASRKSHVDSTTVKDSAKTVPGGTVGEEFGGAVGSFFGLGGATIGRFLGGLAARFCPLLAESTERMETERETVSFLQDESRTQSDRTDWSAGACWNLSTSLSHATRQLGKWRLHFVVEFSDPTTTARYRVGKDPKVWLCGLSRPVCVACPDRAGQEFGADGLVCSFDCPVGDSVLLQELKSSSRGQLFVRVRAADFSIECLTTGRKNVLDDLADRRRETPVTEIALPFGDAAPFSPWCVRRQYVGKDGARHKVTLGEAVRAINAEVSKNEALPESLFDIAPDGLSWRTVSERPVVRPATSRKDFVFLGLDLKNMDGEETLRPLLGVLAQERIERYSRMSVVALSLERTACEVFSNETSLAGMKKDMEIFLEEPGREEAKIFWQERWAALESDREAHRPREFVAGTSRSLDICGEKFEFVYCPSNASQRGFWLGTTEVTQRQWKHVMGENPSSNSAAGELRPVDSVAYDDAMRFCKRLEEISDVRFRLPSVQEWSWACSAGESPRVLTVQELDAIAWHSGNSDGCVHDVKGKQPNGWGFYDLLGNVIEWASDSRDGGVYRSLVGGFFGSELASCQPNAEPDMMKANERDLAVGLRLVAEISTTWTPNCSCRHQ